MAPYTSVSTTTLTQQEVPSIERNNNNNNNNRKTIARGKKEAATIENPNTEYKTIIGTYGAELKWVNIIAIFILHIGLAWGLLFFPYIRMWPLFLWGFVIGGCTGFGVTAGAHRLWCHRSYKATLPLRIILMLCFSLAAQNSLYDWVRDHRVHHKYTETDADPHNSKRGFFFAHVGWLMMKKHPDVIKKGKEVDMSDVLADPVVRFHEKHFVLLKILVGFVIPSIIPPLLFGQDWYWSFLLICIGRYCFSLNFTWLVNSAAHMWGNKPYDKNISPTENLGVSILALGEGWHNYHHTFPWDYKTAELGKYSVNLTAFWIDVFAKIGWAYDLKTPSRELVERVVKKSGDGSHPVWGHIEIPEDADVHSIQDDDNDVTNDNEKNDNCSASIINDDNNISSSSNCCSGSKKED